MKIIFKYRILIICSIITLLINNITYAAGETDLGLGRILFKLVFYTLVFIGVVIFAIYGTKFIARNSVKFTNSKYIKVMEVLKLDANMKIILLEVNESIYILAMTAHAIEIIDKFSKDKMKINDQNQFQKELNKYYHSDIKKNDYKFNFQKRVSNLIINARKLIDKEENNNEKMD